MIDAHALQERGLSYIAAAKAFNLRLPVGTAECMELIRRLIAAEAEVERLKAQEAKT